MSETSHFIVTDFAKRVYIFTECDVNMVIESNIRPKQVKQMRISRKKMHKLSTGDSSNFHSF